MDAGLTRDQCELIIVTVFCQGRPQSTLSQLHGMLFTVLFSTYLLLPCIRSIDYMSVSLLDSKLPETVYWSLFAVVQVPGPLLRRCATDRCLLCGVYGAWLFFKLCF